MADYPAVARILKWDGTQWVHKWQTHPSHEIRLRCSFLGYRIENRASLELIDTGRATPSISFDVLDDIQREAGALYRLDIFANDTRQPMDNKTFPSGWIDMPIFWSGLLQRVRFNFDRTRRGCSLEAVGWTSFLERIQIQAESYEGVTPRFITTDLFTRYVQPAWPGTITIKRPTDGTDNRLILDEFVIEVLSFRQVLEELSVFSTYTFGVSVSGYPTEINQEFRLIHSEPDRLTDEAIPAQGLGHNVGVTIDVDQNPDCVAYERVVDNQNYVNQWVVTGAPLHADVLSVVTGHDADDVVDYFATDDEDTGQTDHEPRGLVNFDLVIKDRARRQNFLDTDSGERFLAGRLEPVDDEFPTLEDDLRFEIISTLETTHSTDVTLGAILFTFREFPAPEVDLTLNVLTTALRYQLVPRGANVLRIVKDKSDTDTRETIERAVADDRVQGWLQAVLLAYQDRWGERFESEVIRLTVRRWTQLPTGSGEDLVNQLVITTPSDRMTLIGSTAQGGDNYSLGDDPTRKVGFGRVLEIQQAECQYTEDGWDITWTLGALPRELTRALIEADLTFRRGPRRLSRQEAQVQLGNALQGLIDG